MIILSDLSYRGGPGNNCLWPSTVTCPLHVLSVVEWSPVAGELLFLQPQGHVTLHPFAGLARVVLVVADFKGIRDG